MKIRDYVTILILVALDQITKYVVSTKMTLGQSITLIKDFFSLTYARNIGAAFSILEGNQWFFVVVACLTSIGLIIYLSKNKTDMFEKEGLLMVVAGALGNCIDRVRFQYVIDFLDFNLFGWDYPVFNVADIFVCVGVGFLVISLLFVRKES